MTIFCNRDDCPEQIKRADAFMAGWKETFHLWYCPKHEHNKKK